MSSVAQSLAYRQNVKAVWEQRLNLSHDTHASIDAQSPSREVRPSPWSKWIVSQRVLVAYVACTLLAFVTLASLVSAHATDSVDASIRAEVHAHSSATWTTLAIFASDTIAPTRLAVLGVVLALWFVQRGWPRAAVLLAVNMLGVMMLDLVLKRVFHRPRPEAFWGYHRPESFGFPSGHSFFSLSYFAQIAVLLWPRLRARAARWGSTVLAVLLSGCIGLSRVYLGVHHPSDVVGGFLVACCWLSVVALMDRALAHRALQRSWDRLQQASVTTPNGG